MQSRVSILGLYNYTQTYNYDLFNKLELPDSELLDRQTLIDNILIRSADFECLYPNPDFLEFKIGIWSKKNYRTFEKWAKALELEYNPIENYDRFEDWNDDSNGKSIIDTTNQNSGGVTTNTFKSAFDSNDMQDDAKSITDDTSKLKVDGVNTGENHLIHKGRIHGNIGVTTSMALVTEELNLARFNLIDQITDLFIQEFCILVY